MVSPAADRRLARMLGGEHPELLTEWLAEAAARGLRPAPEALPALLERARRARSADHGLADLVAEAGGPRARWLAALNPDWEFAAAPARGDRAEEVRTRAVNPLSSLPGSAAGQQVAEQALRCVRIEPGAHGPRVLVTPPPARPGQPDRARIVLEMVAQTPLRAWTAESGLTAAQIVATPAGHWTPVLLTAWIRAATAQRDRDWTAALAGLGEPGPEAPPALRAALRGLRFRYDMLKELTDDGHDG